MSLWTDTDKAASCGFSRVDVKTATGAMQPCYFCDCHRSKRHVCILQNYPEGYCRHYTVWDKHESIL